MSDRGNDHTAFDELAAGHAVHALEPADELRFLRHAADCARCGRSAAQFREVAAALAETAYPVEPDRQLGERILAAAVSERDGDQPPAQVVPLPRRGGHASRHRAGRRWPKVAAAAAAAGLIAAGGVWAGLRDTAGGRPPAAAMCAKPARCVQVTLTAAATGRPAAKVIIHDGRVWMDAPRMAANPAGDIYVLWQITGGHTPLPVGSFDIRPGSGSLIQIGGLAAPYTATWAFAVSLEHGRTIPDSPSNPVALGQVS